MVNHDSRFSHHNQPIFVSVYKDHEAEQEKVIILCVLPAGVTDVRFHLLGSGPGTMLAVVEYILYDWPPITYGIDALFGEEIKRGEKATCDPRIAALKDDGLSIGINKRNFTSRNLSGAQSIFRTGNCTPSSCSCQTVNIEGVVFQNPHFQCGNFESLLQIRRAVKKGDNAVYFRLKHYVFKYF